MYPLRSAQVPTLFSLLAPVSHDEMKKAGKTEREKMKESGDMQ